MNSIVHRMAARKLGRIAVLIGLVAALNSVSVVVVQAQTVLDFSDIPPNILTIFSPYTSHGFQLTSSTGGFTFNSPGTGNGSLQPPGNNPFYAGANALAGFSPGTITIMRTDGDAFSMTSIDLARNFAFDPAPSVTFVGTLDGGGTVSETFTVTSPSPPLAFQKFNFSGFTGLKSMSWDQPFFTAGLHQFTNVTIAAATTAPVPEPGIMALLAGTFAVCGTVFVRKRRG